MYASGDIGDLVATFVLGGAGSVTVLGSRAAIRSILVRRRAAAARAPAPAESATAETPGVAIIVPVSALPAPAKGALGRGVTSLAQTADTGVGTLGMIARVVFAVAAFLPFILLLLLAFLTPGTKAQRRATYNQLCTGYRNLALGQPLSEDAIAAAQEQIDANHADAAVRVADNTIRTTLSPHRSFLDRWMRGDTTL